MPALVASTLYLLSTPVNGRKLFRYLLPPLFWCLAGALVSFLVYGIFLKTNGHISTIFDSSMQYHYLSFKLWPNPGFDLGLIPGMVILSLPLGILVVFSAAHCDQINIHWFRLAWARWEFYLYSSWAAPLSACVRVAVTTSTIMTPLS